MSSLCYERLNTILLENAFEKGSIDTMLFIKKFNYDILNIKKYVNDFIFFLTNNYLCEEFFSMMSQEF